MLRTSVVAIVGKSCVIAMLLPRAAMAQAVTSLTISSITVSFPAPAAADYAAGYLYASPNTTATVQATIGAVNDRNSLLYIRSATGNLGGAKPISDLEYKCTTGSTWTQMSTTDALVAQNRMGVGGPNNPWTCALEFRIKLDWTVDVSGNTIAASLLTTLTTTTP